MKPLRPVNQGRAITKSYPIPASTKGWVKNQAITKMDPLAAYQLDNWFPDPDSLRLRHGTQKFATLPETTPVETVMSYISGATQKLLAAVNGKIYDATPGGVIASALVTGLTNNRWQTTNFATPGGQWLMACNGADPVANYNGTTWATTPAITGVSPNVLINVWSYQQRLFFCELNTANVWYLAVNSIGGAATSLPLGPMLIKGGSIIAGGQWSYSTGVNLLNLCVFVSSEGEVLVYQGNDPSSSTTWAKIAQFVVGRPIGRRCLLNVNSDLVILCEDGLMPLSKAIQYDRAAASKAAFTWNIQKAFMDAYFSYGTNFGWQILTYAKSNMAIINVPTSTGTTSVQYVMNVITGAWAQFIGINASSWISQEDSLYFGGVDGQVYQADTGSADGTTPISATWVSAYNDLGMPSISKSARMIRAIFLLDSGIAPSIGVSFDFNVITPSPSGAISIPSQSLWGVARWGISRWGSINPATANWTSAVGDGYQAAAVVTVNSAGLIPTVGITCKITTAYVLFEPGSYV